MKRLICFFKGHVWDAYPVMFGGKRITDAARVICTRCWKVEKCV